MTEIMQTGLPRRTRIIAPPGFARSGGALLEFMGKGDLPALAALRDRAGQ